MSIKMRCNNKEKPLTPFVPPSKDKGTAILYTDNEKLVFSVLKESDVPLFVLDIAKITKLSSPAVSGMMRSFVIRGIVEKVPYAQYQLIRKK